MEQNILKLFRRPNYRPLNSQELLRQLGLPQNKQRQLDHVLAQLERSGQIARIKQGKRYALPLEADLVPGRIRMNRQGIGLLQPDDPQLPCMAIMSSFGKMRCRAPTANARLTKLRAALSVFWKRRETGSSAPCNAVGNSSSWFRTIRVFRRTSMCR